jgi:hypothetical protein
MDISGALSAVESPDPADGLRAVAVLRRLAEHLEAAHVVRARQAGWTWAEIGDALGVSRQAVHKKHRRIG